MKLVLFLGGLGFAAAAVGNATELCMTILGNAECSKKVFGGSNVPSQATCELGFTGFTPGMDNDTLATNTIGCRQRHANMAVNASTAFWCQYAGFTGGGRCGNPLDGTCMANANFCPVQHPNASFCMANLTNLAVIWGSKQGVDAAGENSLECRVYHASVGSTEPVNAPFHCTHAWDVMSPCTGTVTPDTNHYCGTALSACTGQTNNQYNNWAECVSSHNIFPAGAGIVAANNANDRSCRQYHIQAAGTSGAGLGPANGHCQHGGPSGGGVCGGADGGRDSWLLFANQSACMTPQDGYVSASLWSAFANWAPADFAMVVPKANYGQYATGASGNTDSCRLYHLTVATNAPSHCSHGDLIGANQCGDAATNACGLISTACGTTVYATNTSCITAINALFAGNKLGSPTDMTGKGDTLSCRLFNAGVALAAKKGGGSTTATCNAAKACAGGSNTTTTSAPTAAPTAASKSSASALVFSMMAFLPVLAL